MSTMRKPFAITLDVGSGRANHTGAWRTERPVYVDRLPPCNNACPAGENIQQWLYDAEEGPAKYEAAWRQIMQDNPFPAVMGRVCYRPCETACNRAQLDSAVGINSVERYLGDEALSRLTRLGHAVTIKDAGAAPGGMMRYGIPKYRLPRDILDAEVRRILDMGVTLELNTRVTDIQAELDSGFDAAFVAVGAHIGRRAYIPAGDSARILDAVSVLHGMEDSDPPLLGRRVAVYGGGNTAMDAARTATTQAVGREPGNRFGQGKNVPLIAMATVADLRDLEYKATRARAPGVVEVGPDLMTGHPGIFAGGDMVPSERTVTVAIGHGKKAARHVDAWLRGQGSPAADKHAPAPFGALNTWYYADAPATVRPRLEAARRIGTFDEVTGGLDESTALFEARRCMSCGNCFGCDNCYGVCPDNAIVKLADGRYEVDYDYCKGCGLCVAECPCGAIEMTPELA